MRVAVVGAGMSGLGAAYELAKAGVNVCLFDKHDKLGGGGHPKTLTVNGLDLDLRFMLFNRISQVASPNLEELLESLGVETENWHMSFSVSLDKGFGCEWGTQNGLSSLFAQKKNLLNPYFWKMLYELSNFKDDVLMYLDELETNLDMDRTKTLGSFIKSRGYSELFERAYLIPVCASIWRCGSQQVMDSPAFSILSCLRMNDTLQLFGGPQWLTVKGGSDCYVNKLTKQLVDRGCQIRTNCEVHYVSSSDEGCKLYWGDGSEDVYDGCILAVDAPDAIKLLGQQATYDETMILGAFQYFHSDVFLHQDKSLMPQNPSTWGALNFLESSQGQFTLTYWLNIIQVCMEADLGLADAYINGDFSLVDTNKGLFNLFMLFIANSDINPSDSGHPHKKRNWWVPMLYTSSIASAKYVYRHFTRQNSLTQARRNISRHYDVSNDIFSIFLGETMTYSTAIFKSVDEDLSEAQLRKMCVLIKKARIEKDHEVLDIGCGWGTLAIEVVKHTGCKYTGITLSEQQLRFAEERVKKSGYQDRIKLLLCDYRELPRGHKYDRIISCEMIEHVGHEYMEEFFRCCDSALTENGVFVLQFIEIRDDRYDEYRRGPGFIKEYIFPGGCLPSLSRVTSAMASASRLCVEEIENIGVHYYQTLRCWRQNFLDQRRKVASLGFDDKFIRTWEYYFDYCAAGFNSRSIHDYQVVFSRPGNAIGYKNPYEGVSSFNCC